MLLPSESLLSSPGDGGGGHWIHSPSSSTSPGGVVYSSSQILHRIHLNVRRCVRTCHSDPRIIHMKLTCLVLDRLNSEYVVSFLRRTPRIRQLCLDCCKLSVDAQAVWIQYFRDADCCRIEEIDVFGDYNVSEGRFAGIDDGSCLECLSKSMKGNKSVVDLWLWGLQPTLNAAHVRNLLKYKRNLRKFKMEDCSLDVPLLAEGLRAQSSLHAFYLNMEYLPLAGQSTATLMQALLGETGNNNNNNGATNLALLHLENCGITVPLIQALVRWLIKRGCQFKQVSFLLQQESSSATSHHHEITTATTATLDQEKLDHRNNLKSQFLTLLKSSPNIFVRELSFYDDNGGDAFLDLVQDDLLPFLQRNQILIQKKKGTESQWNVFLCGESWGL